APARAVPPGGGTDSSLTSGRRTFDGPRSGLRRSPRISSSPALARGLLMNRLVPALLAVLLALVPPAAEPSVTAVAAMSAPGGPGASDGLYPLWEQTAVLPDAGTFRIGYQHAAVGLGRVQLGTQPILDLHGALNIEAKAALWRGPRFQLALV